VVFDAIETTFLPASVIHQRIALNICIIL